MIPIFLKIALALNSYKYSDKGIKNMKKRKVIKIIGGILLAVVLVFVAFLGILTLREYRPDAVETLEVSGGTKKLSEGDTLTVLTYNTGYAGLSRDEDFFMDGGTKVRPDSKELVEENLAGISSILEEQDADVYFLQEVDRNARRTYHIDELEYYEQALGLDGIYACNFKCDFVPYPFPPIGKVDAGLVSMTDYEVSSASRIALPESFSWPIKTCNLKRCMLEMRIPIEGSDKELVLLNFHLEAYDSGEGKIAQSKMLAQKLQEEYEKGNYVIAGGDFNQTFEGMDTYPILDTENWTPGIVGNDDIPDGFSFAVADNVPSCRLLSGPYSGNYEDSQVYVIDGFIVSDNLEITEIENIDTDFTYSDHQPVRLSVCLKME
jgi:endonuclease/exonuclease/phosphatase family metal-dependent hydrolase